MFIISIPSLIMSMVFFITGIAVIAQQIGINILDFDLNQSYSSPISNVELQKLLTLSDEEVWQLLTGRADCKTEEAAAALSQEWWDSRMETFDIKIRKSPTEVTTMKLRANKELVVYWQSFFQDLADKCPNFYIDPSSTGAYNYRPGEKKTAHRYGSGVDINWDKSYNGANVKPLTLSQWQSYNGNDKNYLLYYDSPMIKIAEAYTMSWGGYWNNPHDGMHLSFVGDWSRQRAIERYSK